MVRLLTHELVNKVGQKILVKGWIDSLRLHGKLIFAVAAFAEAKKLKPEYVIEVSGKIKERDVKMVNDKILTGKVEMEVESLKIISIAEPLPFDLSKNDLDVSLNTLLDYRSLALRHPKIKAIFKVQEVIIDSFRKSLQEKSFVEFQAPSMISSAPEGGAEIFEVKYFKYKAYLAQSPQLYKSLLVSIFERVFSVNKVFRAEPSMTTRHLTEVVSLDAEFGFIESWEEVRKMAEYVITYILKEVQTKCQKELDLFGVTIPSVSKEIPFLKLREAQQIIFERTGRDCRKEKDPSPDDEREICKWAKEVHRSDLVFITHYPTKYRPFYTYPDDDNPEYNQGFDLLGRGMEWLTGGRRIHDYKTLLEHAEKWGIHTENIELYLQAFRYGMPPLGGFAFGAERITMNILGLTNIREASLFPRDMERVDLRLSGLQKGNKKEKNLFEEIIEILNEKEINYQLFNHEAVYTSEEAAKVRGTKMEQGAKALILIADKKPVMTVMSAVKKVDFKKIKKEKGIKDLRMATADEVKNISGVEVGAVPPFGNLFDIPTFFDVSLEKQDKVSFNAGMHTRSVEIKYKDLKKAVNPDIFEFTSEKKDSK